MSERAHVMRVFDTIRRTVGEGYETSMVIQ